MTSRSDELQGVRKLYEFSRLLLAGDDPEDLLKRLVEATRVITDADEVIIFEISEGEPVVEALSSGAPQQVEEPQYSQTLVEEVIEKGEPLLLEDVCDDPRFEKSQSVQMLSITSAIGVPLFHRQELTGIIYAARQRMAQNFNREHRELMTVAASQASLVLGRLATIKALRDSESRYRSLVEMSPSTIVVVQEGRIVFVNQTACRLWERESVRELLGIDIAELFDPWRSQILLERLQKEAGFDSVDAWVKKTIPDVTVPVEVVGEPVQFDGSCAMQLMISEVGEKKALMAQRVRMDRLVVMGTMAATVGHEINNPLSYVYTNLDFVVEELENQWLNAEAQGLEEAAREDVMAALRSAREGTERIRAVVDSIQNFTRLDDGSEEPTIVGEPLKSSLRIARSKLQRDVDLQVDIRPTEPVPISASRLGQVFLNILINGAQALQQVSAESVEEKRLEVRTRQNGDEVIVEIADNGPGIRPEVQSHIFEPFVSTKSGESGTGLGLAICHEIVDSSGGRIEVESTVGEGSLFRIVLPRTEEVATQSMEFMPASDGEYCGRILIVDPEPTLGSSLQRALQNQHEVTTASTKGEAVDLMSGAREFDVILCDLRLRGGMGQDLFRKKKKHAPQHWGKLVAMTPNRITKETRQYLDRLPNPWIAKPFDIHRLRAIIDGLLEAAEKDAHQSCTSRG